MPESEHVVDVQQLVLPDAELPPAGWYAQPLAPSAAAGLHQEARRAVQRALAGGAVRGQPLAPRLVELIAGFWLDRAVALDHRSLIMTHPPESAALVELVYGQLLISRKRAGAFAHLDRGFALLARHLAPSDYLTLLRRHDWLRALPLREEPSVPQTLAELLTEARVIRRLEPAGRRPGDSPHEDTLG